MIVAEGLRSNTPARPSPGISAFAKPPGALAAGWPVEWNASHHENRERPRRRAGLARWLLYVRSHWLRMPPLLLARHLLRKSLRRGPVRV